MMMTRSGRRGKKSVGAFFFPSARCGNSLPRLKTPFLETTVVATMELSFAFLAASSSIGGRVGGMLGRSQCNAVRKNVGTVVLPQKYI